MHRADAESATNARGSGYDHFQTTITLQERVRRQVEELEAALRDNERIMSSLRRSEARCHGLVSQSLVRIAIVGGARLTHSNSRLAEILGNGVDEMLRLNPVDLALEDDRPSLAEQMRKLLSGDVEGVGFVFRRRRKSGTRVNLEIYTTGMEIGGKLALILLVVDVPSPSAPSTKCGRCRPNCVKRPSVVL